MHAAFETARKLPRLPLGVSLECLPGTDLHILRFASGDIPLSEGAAMLLRLCDGTNDRAQIRAHLTGLGRPAIAAYVEAFLDAASKKRWIVETAYSALPPLHAPACSVF
jgi:hypothetical protein